MNRKLLVVAAVVLAGAGAGTVVFLVQGRRSSHPHPASSGPSEHGAGMDKAMGAVLAEYSAPEGSTPCETAYNALKASQDFSTQEHVTAVVLRLAPRDEFLQRCGALPEATQRCLGPRYINKHRAECDKAKPAAGVLAAMVELKSAGGSGAPDPEQVEVPSGSPP